MNNIATFCYLDDLQESLRWWRLKLFKGYWALYMLKALLYNPDLLRNILKLEQEIPAATADYPEGIT
jgi:hypothetical protein